MHAIIMAFDVDVVDGGEALAITQGAIIKIYKLLFTMQDDIASAITFLSKSAKGIVNDETGNFEVKEKYSFTVKNKKMMALGCVLKKGVLELDGIVVVNGAEKAITSLKKQKVDVKQVCTGQEFGIIFEDCADVNIGQSISCFKKVDYTKIKRFKYGVESCF